MVRGKKESEKAGLKLNFQKTKFMPSSLINIAESEEEIKTLRMSLKEESEKAGLKLNIQKTKIMVPGPITSWKIEGEEVETVSDFIFLGFKITVDSDCSSKIKRCLLPGRNAMTNLDSIFKSRHITLPTEVCIVKVMVFW